MSDHRAERVVAVNRGVEPSGGAAPRPGEPHLALVIHTAYGRIGEFDGGGVEIIGYDAASGEYAAHLFDSAGNHSTHHLVADGDTWTYHGDTTRATVEFSEGNTVQTVLHERTDDGSTFVASMRVTLSKVA
jgi:VCBS repeat-containing protein